MKRFFVNENGFVEKPDWKPYCWINIECPDDDDYRLLSRDFHVPFRLIEYIADPDESPRIERDGEWTLAILRLPACTEGGTTPYSTVTLGVISAGEILITVCYSRTEALDDFIGNTRIRGISITNLSCFILHIIFSATDWYIRYLNKISRTVDKSEKDLKASIRNDDILLLMQLQKSLVLFNTAINANGTLIPRLKSMYPDDFNADLSEDVEIELNQAANTVSVYSEILNGTMDAFASIISNNVNGIMKHLTGISIVLMVPTLIASFYGMNVSIGMSNNPHAFWLIILISAILSAICYFVFRRLNWL